MEIRPPGPVPVTSRDVHANLTGQLAHRGRGRCRGDGSRRNAEARTRPVVWPPRRQRRAPLGVRARAPAAERRVERPEPRRKALRRGRRGRGSLGRFGLGRRTRRPLIDDGDGLARLHLVPGLDANLLHHARQRRRHFDGGLVGFELQDRLIDLDRITRLHQHLQDVALGDAVTQIRAGRNRPLAPRSVLSSAFRLLPLPSA